jgi:ribosome-binding protein aMBF1 (putative translation factor)
MTKDQCRAARELLGWTRADLSKNSSVYLAGINAFETGRAKLSEKAISKLRRAFLLAGIELLRDAAGVGVRRRPTVDELATMSAELEWPNSSSQEGAITIEQCRAARGLLGWSQGDAATELGVGLSTIVGLETGRVALQERSLRKIREGFESRGLVFSDRRGVLTVGLRVGPA